MNIEPESVVAMQAYGYTHTQAEFLCLIATHAGYFTRHQFLRFAHAQKGGTASRFTERILRLHHGRTTRYGRQTLVYELYSRLIYDVINKGSLRHHGRHLSNDLVRTRLLILDFVLDHLEHDYLETQADKVAYFHRKLGLPLPVLPGKIYPGIQSNSNTKHYFVDRFPIFIPSRSDSRFLPLAPAFVYCDGEPGLVGYISHLRRYERLLNQLPSFNFVYAAPNNTKFKRAEEFFVRLFACDQHLNTDYLVRYFQIRKLWEDHKTSVLTKPDRQLLRDGDSRFHSQIFADAYRQWTAAKISQSDLNDALLRAKVQQNRRFSTYVLSENYDIFERLSKDCSTHQAGTISRNRSSRVGSSQPSSPVPAISLECIKNE
jgi:hypothetical protein